MPHHPEDQRYPHLSLTREERQSVRRKKKGFPRSSPDRGDRQTYGTQLIEATHRLTEQRERQRPLPGIQPHLVFRIPLAPNAHTDTVTRLLEQHCGLTVVSIESDNAVVVFRLDTDLHAFRRSIQCYQDGPLGQQRTSQYDTIAHIEVDGMRLWTREDRLGPRLAQDIGRDCNGISPENLYTLDLEVWHPGTHEQAHALLDEIRQFVTDQTTTGERWLDHYVGDALLLAKVVVRGTTLDRLLDCDSIAHIDLPPVAHFDPIQATHVRHDDIPPPPRPPANGPRVCIIDSGIVSNHPLLAPYVGHEESFLSSSPSPADTQGHGTKVGGLAVFGNIRTCYDTRSFASPITLFSARVLNDDNTFDNERLIINQLRHAVETFTAHPYNCRVFNLSIGSFDPGISAHNRRQNHVAEALDIIAKEYNVLLIIATGNYAPTERAEETVRHYPRYLFQPAARLSDFATAAIPLTVGAITEHDHVAEQRHTDDIIRTIARMNEPSPFTRTGPGVMDAIKPEFVHYGGNLVFDRLRRERCRNDAGASVMSLSHRPTEQLFAYDVGTSFAAPQVARLAALLDHHLQEQGGQAPHPNLIRAILATSTHELRTSRLDEHEHIKAYGYGIPDEEFALSSASRRVTLYAHDTIPLDWFHIYRVPVPDEFLQAPGTRTIRVALAFDPPVRGRRLDYLGVEMRMRVIRGKTIEDIYNVYRRNGRGENNPAIESPYNVRLTPPDSSPRGGYKRQKSTLQHATFTMKQNPKNGNYSQGSDPGNGNAGIPINACKAANAVVP